MAAIGLLGILVFVLFAFLLSHHKTRIEKKTVLWGLGLQFIFAVLVLGIPDLNIPGVLQPLFAWANDVVIALLNYTLEGSKFVFGELVNTESMGFIFAFQVLPTILFFSTLTAIAYHLGLLQKVVKAFALVMQKIMGTSGAETLSATGNVFVGQTEAPLLIRPYIEKMTKSELLAVMVGGMATVAGGVLAAYVGLLKDRIPDIAGHLITASVMSAPAALAISKLLIPETEEAKTAGEMKLVVETKDRNIIGAAARGATEGLQLALNVAAMLLVFIALIALVNGFLSFLGDLIGFSNWGQFLALAGSHGDPKLTLELLLGWLFAPISWLMGVPWHEAKLVGSLLGQKIVLNEFVAYVNLTNITDQLSDRSIIITSYALCGFANFSSIGIQIGGIGTIAPSRKQDLAELGILSVVGGSLAAFLTATIAGLLI